MNWTQRTPHGASETTGASLWPPKYASSSIQNIGQRVWLSRNSSKNCRTNTSWTRQTEHELQFSTVHVYTVSQSVTQLCAWSSSTNSCASPCDTHSMWLTYSMHISCKVLSALLLSHLQPDCGVLESLSLSTHRVLVLVVIKWVL